MKKTLYTIGVILIAGIVVYSAYSIVEAQKTTTQTNTTQTNTNTSLVWQTYEHSNPIFTIEYPENWEVKTSGYDNVVESISNIVFYPINVEYPSYYFGIYWDENTENIGCKSWIDKNYQKFIDEYPDMTERAQMEAYPVENVIINGIDACRTPDSFNTENHDERYVIANGDMMYTIIFPADQDSPNILNPEANNAIAHQMLESLKFN